MIIQWGALYNWWVLFVAAFAVALYWYKYIKRNRSAALLDKRGTLLKNFSPTKNIMKAFLASVGVIFVALALLHPKWGRIDEKVEQHGRDIFIALDISRSMLTQDCKFGQAGPGQARPGQARPGQKGSDRLAIAKQAIKSLVSALETDRVSLVVFSEKARIYCPLTKDVDLVNTFVDQIDHTTIGSGTTLLDQPIQTTIEQCERFPDRKSKLLLLVTDGEDFSDSLDVIKKKANDAGLTILIIGVGTKQGAPIPLYDEKGKRNGYIKDSNDQVVISQLHPESLHNLAEATGGMAVMLDNNGMNVSNLVAKIKQFEKEKQGAHKVSAMREQYSWFLLVSFICFLLEWLL